LYALGAPIEERRDTPEGVEVRAKLPRRDLRRFAQYVVATAVGSTEADQEARGGSAGAGRRNSAERAAL
ncbi:MAG: hypothetical protein ACXVZL_11390, partial [Gaiellaceae bacterium]